MPPSRPEQSGKRARTLIARMLRIVVSVSLIGYVLTLIDLPRVLDRLAGVRMIVLIVVLLLQLVQMGLSTLKWKLILAADGVARPFGPLLVVYLKGNFLSLFLPTSFGGDVYRIYSVHRSGGGLARSTSSVLFDRITGLFALVSIALVAYAFLPSHPYLGPMAAVYLAGIGGFLGATSESAGRISDRIASPLLRRLASPLRSFSVYRRDPAMLAAAITIALLFQLNIVMINKLYCVALGIHMSLGHLLVIVPLIYLTEVLPISINGIGVRDSAYVFFFVLLGFASDEGLALALLVLLMRYVFGLIGGSLLLVESVRARNPRGTDL
jgi:hypothetical protein